MTSCPSNARAPILLAALLVSVQLSAPSTSAQQATAPPAVQADTFAKIFPFDRRLGDLSQLTVVIVRPAAAGALEASLTELEGAFQAAGMTAHQAQLTELAALLSPTTAVYLVAETATDEVLSLIAEAGALSISGSHELAEAGKVSVALDSRGGRPEIVVHLARVESEGHEFSAQLLRVARVVRGGSDVDSGESRGPRVVRMDDPQYPEMARRMRLQGEVVVRIRVSETGVVEEVELERGISPSGGLNEAALAAARSATFEPALRDGQPVAEWVTRTFRFRL